MKASFNRLRSMYNVLVNGNHGLLQINSAEFFYLKKSSDFSRTILSKLAVRGEPSTSKSFPGFNQKKKKRSSTKERELEHDRDHESLTKNIEIKMVDDGDHIDYDKQRNIASKVFNRHYMKKKKKRRILGRKI